MASSKSVAKMRVASRVCKLGAWVVAAIGIIMIGIYISTILPLIPYFRQYQGVSPYSYSAYTSVISSLFLIVVPTLFFAIILYAMGTLMEYMSSSTETEAIEARTFVEDEKEDNYEDREDERIKIVPLPEMR